MYSSPWGAAMQERGGGEGEGAKRRVRARILTGPWFQVSSKGEESNFTPETSLCSAKPMPNSLSELWPFVKTLFLTPHLVVQDIVLAQVSVDKATGLVKCAYDDDHVGVHTAEGASEI